MSTFEDWQIPYIISYLEDSDLASLRYISHFWNHCVTESLSYPPITLTTLHSKQNGLAIKMKCKPHQHRPSRILIVGDGNFSFSLSLCKLLPPIHFCSICKIPKQQRMIVTSTLCPDADALCKIHPFSALNIDQIHRDYPFCSVLFGVDATNLSDTLSDDKGINSLKFDEIIWNFPHSNDHRHIATNRHLLRDFCISAAPKLVENGILKIRLCFGQGGTPKEEESLNALIASPDSNAIPLSLSIDSEFKNRKNGKVIRLKYEAMNEDDGVIDVDERVIQKTKTIKVREYNNSWKMVEMASYSRFILVDIRPFYWTVFRAMGYRQTGRKGHDRRFLMDLSLTHSLIQEDHSLNRDLVRKLYPQTMFRDISFWLSDEWNQFMEQHSFEDFVYETLGTETVFKVEYLNQFVHPQTGKCSKTFRIWYCEKKRAFNKFKCNEMQSILRDALRDHLNVGVAHNPNQQK